MARPPEAGGMREFELPMPPSLNHYYRVFRGQTVISRRGRAFRQAVGAILARQGIRPAEGKVCCAVTLYPPDGRRRDADNILKSLMDALEHGGALGDDSQVYWLMTLKAAPVPGGKVVVRLLPFAAGAMRQLCDTQISEVASWN